MNIQNIYDRKREELSLEELNELGKMGDSKIITTK